MAGAGYSEHKDNLKWSVKANFSLLTAARLVMAIKGKLDHLKYDLIRNMLTVKYL